MKECGRRMVRYTARKWNHVSSRRRVVALNTITILVAGIRSASISSLGLDNHRLGTRIIYCVAQRIAKCSLQVYTEPALVSIFPIAPSITNVTDLRP